MVGLRAMYTNWLNFRVYICNWYPTSVSISVCRNVCNPCRFPYIGMYYMYVIHVIFYISACMYTRLSNVMPCEELQKCKNYLRNRVCRLTALHPQVTLLHGTSASTDWRTLCSRMGSGKWMNTLLELNSALFLLLAVCVVVRVFAAAQCVGVSFTLPWAQVTKVLI